MPRSHLRRSVTKNSSKKPELSRAKSSPRYLDLEGPCPRSEKCDTHIEHDSQSHQHLKNSNLNIPKSDDVNTRNVTIPCESETESKFNCDPQLSYRGDCGGDERQSSMLENMNGSGKIGANRKEIIVDESNGTAHVLGGIQDLTTSTNRPYKCSPQSVPQFNGRNILLENSSGDTKITTASSEDFFRSVDCHKKSSLQLCEYSTSLYPENSCCEGTAGDVKASPSSADALYNYDASGVLKADFKEEKIDLITSTHNINAGKTYTFKHSPPGNTYICESDGSNIAPTGEDCDSKKIQDVVKTSRPRKRKSSKPKRFEHSERQTKTPVQRTLPCNNFSNTQSCNVIRKDIANSDDPEFNSESSSSKNIETSVDINLKPALNEKGYLGQKVADRTYDMHPKNGFGANFEKAFHERSSSILQSNRSAHDQKHTQTTESFRDGMLNISQFDGTLRVIPLGCGKLRISKTPMGMNTENNEKPREGEFSNSASLKPVKNTSKTKVLEQTTKELTTDGHGSCLKQNTTYKPSRIKEEKTAVPVHRDDKIIQDKIDTSVCSDMNQRYIPELTPIKEECEVQYDVTHWYEMSPSKHQFGSPCNSPDSKPDIDVEELGPEIASENKVSNFQFKPSERLFSSPIPQTTPPLARDRNSFNHGYPSAFQKPSCTTASCDVLRRPYLNAFEAQTNLSLAAHNSFYGVGQHNLRPKHPLLSAVPRFQHKNYMPSSMPYMPPTGGFFAAPCWPQSFPSGNSPVGVSPHYDYTTKHFNVDPPFVSACYSMPFLPDPTSIFSPQRITGGETIYTYRGKNYVPPTIGRDLNNAHHFPVVPNRFVAPQEMFYPSIRRNFPPHYHPTTRITDSHSYSHLSSNKTGNNPTSSSPPPALVIDLKTDKNATGSTKLAVAANKGGGKITSSRTQTTARRSRKTARKPSVFNSSNCNDDFIDPTRLKFGQDDIEGSDEDEIVSRVDSGLVDTSDEEWRPGTDRAVIRGDTNTEQTGGDSDDDEGDQNSSVTVIARYGRKRSRRSAPRSSDQEKCCPTCGKFCSSDYLLRRHQLSHSDHRPHRCEHCDKGFKQKAHLQGHVKSVHGKMKKTLEVSRVGTERNKSQSSDIPAASSEPAVAVAAAEDKDEPRSEIKETDATDEAVSGQRKSEKSKVEINVPDKSHGKEKSSRPNRSKRLGREQDYSCRICGKTFLTAYRLKRHEQSHTDVRPYACRVCGKRFKQSGHRNEHEANHGHHGVRFLCNRCGVVFRCRSSFNNHMRAHGQEQKHLKKANPVVSSDANGSDVHGCEDRQHHTAGLENTPVYDLHHDVFTAAYDCPYCVEKFATAQALNNHLDSHVEITQRRHVQPFTCKICKRSFTYRHNLFKHSLVHEAPEKFADFYKDKMQAHVASGKPFYKCNHCSKVFLRKETLAKHSKIHTGAKPFKCAVCSQSFTQNIHLKVHMRKHTGSRPFQCRECGKGFIDSTALAKHIEYEACNSENVLYRCKLCHKRHYYMGSIKQHIRKDHGVKEEYLDSHIERSFRSSNKEKGHVNTETAKQTYKNAINTSKSHQCMICTRRYKEKHNLMRHVRQSHTELIKLLAGDSNEISNTVLNRQDFNIAESDACDNNDKSNIEREPNTSTVTMKTKLVDDGSSTYRANNEHITPSELAGMCKESNDVSTAPQTLNGLDTNKLKNADEHDRLPHTPDLETPGSSGDEEQEKEDKITFGKGLLQGFTNVNINLENGANYYNSSNALTTVLNEPHHEINGTNHRTGAMSPAICEDFLYSIGLTVSRKGKAFSNTSASMLENSTTFKCSSEDNNCDSAKQQSEADTSGIRLVDLSTKSESSPNTISVLDLGSKSVSTNDVYTGESFVVDLNQLETADKRHEHNPRLSGNPQLSGKTREDSTSRVDLVETRFGTAAFRDQRPSIDKNSQTTLHTQLEAKNDRTVPLDLSQTSVKMQTVSPLDQNLLLDTKTSETEVTTVCPSHGVLRSSATTTEKEVKMVEPGLKDSAANCLSRAKQSLPLKENEVINNLETQTSTPAQSLCKTSQKPKHIQSERNQQLPRLCHRRPSHTPPEHSDLTTSDVAKPLEPRPCPSASSPTKSQLEAFSNLMMRNFSEESVTFERLQHHSAKQKFLNLKEWLLGLGGYSNQNSRGKRKPVDRNSVIEKLTEQNASQQQSEQEPGFKGRGKGKVHANGKLQERSTNTIKLISSEGVIKCTPQDLSAPHIVKATSIPECDSHEKNETKNTREHQTSPEYKNNVRPHTDASSTPNKHDRYDAAFSVDNYASTSLAHSVVNSYALHPSLPSCSPFLQVTATLSLCTSTVAVSKTNMSTIPLVPQCTTMSRLPRISSAVHTRTPTLSSNLPVYIGPPINAASSVPHYYSPSTSSLTPFPTILGLTGARLAANDANPLALRSSIDQIARKAVDDANKANNKAFSGVGSTNRSFNDAIGQVNIDEIVNIGNRVVQDCITGAESTPSTTEHKSKKRYFIACNNLPTLEQTLTTPEPLPNSSIAPSSRIRQQSSLATAAAAQQPSTPSVTKSPPAGSVSTSKAGSGTGFFPCEQCGKTFNARHRLKRHELTHTDFRPYTCGQCGRAFRQKVHLSDHMKRHAGERPFACSGCGRRFVLKNEMNQHIKHYCSGLSIRWPVPVPLTGYTEGPRLQEDTKLEPKAAIAVSSTSVNVVRVHDDDSCDKKE